MTRPGVSPHQIVNFLGILQNEWAGAQAFSSFDTYPARRSSAGAVSPTKRYDLDNNSDTARNVQGAYDPYVTADVKLRYKLTSWATASFSIDNIFNEQYFMSSKAPGRSWFGELTLRY